MCATLGNLFYKKTKIKNEGGAFIFTKDAIFFSHIFGYNKVFCELYIH